MANEALRFRPVVLLAPIALGLELPGYFLAALRTHFLGHTMLAAPPAFVSVRRGGNRGFR